MTEANIPIEREHHQRTEERYRERGSKREPRREPSYHEAIAEEEQRLRDREEERFDKSDWEKKHMGMCDDNLTIEDEDEGDV